MLPVRLFRLRKQGMIILANLKEKPTFIWLLRHPVCFLAFGFGSGLAPKIPGTVGTLVALPLAFLFYLTGLSSWVLALLCIPLFVVGISICAKSSDLLGVADYGGIVWDEIVAMLLILSFVPLNWSAWLLAYILFRFFDMLKPWPISYFDRTVHGGLGIMLDDLIAVVPTLLVFYLSYSIIWERFL